MELEIAVLSRPGGRAVNEDACGFWSGPAVCFCVISDGAGGHGGGDVASKLVVQEALGSFRDKHEDCNGDAVEAAMRTANEVLVREQGSRVELADMRATVVVLAIDFDREYATWGHLGDSRLYCFRRQRIVAQTRDHSVVQSMVDGGFLRPEELRSSPERSKLLKALGDPEGFEPSVERVAFRLENDDKFLLCTDGVWEYVEESELERTLQDTSSAEEWLRALESYVLARGGSKQDNYSALAVWCKAENRGGSLS